MAKDKIETHDLSNAVILAPESVMPEGVIYRAHSLDCEGVPKEVRDKAIDLLTGNGSSSEQKSGPAMVNNGNFRRGWEATFGSKSTGSEVKN